MNLLKRISEKFKQNKLKLTSFTLAMGLVLSSGAAGFSLNKDKSQTGKVLLKQDTTSTVSPLEHPTSTDKLNDSHIVLGESYPEMTTPRIQTESTTIEEQNPTTEATNHYQLTNQVLVNNNDGTHSVVSEFLNSENGKSKQVTTVVFHEFGPWQPFGDQEVSQCVCGETRYQSHQFGVWMVNEQTNTKVHTCKSCGFQESKKVLFKILYPSVSNSSSSRSDSYHVKGNSTNQSSAHNHRFEQVNVTYTYQNQDMHTTETESICSVDGAKKIETETENCNYAITYKANPTEGKHQEVSTCTKCQHQKEQTVSCVPDGITLYEMADNKIYEYQTCKECGDKCNLKLHTHEPASQELQYSLQSSNENGTHILSATYQCNACKQLVEVTKVENCDYSVTVQPSEIEDKHQGIYTCTVCQHQKEQMVSCIPDGNFSIENVDNVMYEYQNCKECGERTNYKRHIHEEAPADLTYTLLSGNGDQTHTLVGTYQCTICKESLEVTKVEECDFSNSTPTYEKKGPDNFAIYNKHVEVTTCDVCGDSKRQEVPCVPNGTTEYMVWLSTIYEFQTCTDCNNRCEQYPHEHKYGDWEPKDEREHQRRCACDSSPIIEEHSFSFVENKEDPSQNKMVCPTCNMTLAVDHPHLPRNMSLMDMIMSPIYSHVINKTPINNPNPSPEYCYRIDCYCPTCGVFYAVYYDHDYKNGVCTRITRCGGVKDPDYVGTRNTDSEALLNAVEEKEQEQIAEAAFEETTENQEIENNELQNETIVDQSQVENIISGSQEENNATLDETIIIEETTKSEDDNMEAEEEQEISETKESDNADLETDGLTDDQKEDVNHNNAVDSKNTESEKKALTDSQETDTENEVVVDSKDSDLQQVVSTDSSKSAAETSAETESNNIDFLEVEEIEDSLSKAELEQEKLRLTQLLEQFSEELAYEDVSEIEQSSVKVKVLTK